MKRHLLITLLLPLGVAAQNTVGGITGKGLDMQTSPNGYVTALPMAPSETVGSHYLLEDWSVGTLYLSNIKIENYPIRYNVYLNEFEIKTNSEIKVLKGKEVSRFELQTPQGPKVFIDARPYTLDTTPLTGFLELVSDGHWKVFIHTQTKLIKSAYVASLDAGDKNDRITKTNTYYLSNGTELIDTKKIKKKSLF